MQEIESLDSFWQDDGRLEASEEAAAEELAMVLDHEPGYTSAPNPSPSQVEAFKAYCNIAVACSPDGKECSLTVSADANGRTYSKTIDLAPIVEFFARKMREYHIRLHGNDPAVSGFFDWVRKAGKVAKRIATNEGVRSVFKQVATTAIPGLSLAMKAHDVLVKANDGDPQSMAKLAAIKAKADEGDPKANEALTTLRTMNEAIKIKEEKIREEASKPTTIPDRYGGAPLEVMGTGLYGLGIGTEVGKRARTRSRGKPVIPSRNSRKGSTSRTIPPGRVSRKAVSQLQTNTWQPATTQLDPMDPYGDSMGDPYGTPPGYPPGYPPPGYP